ncbi:MAG: transposase, partial [Spirochaetota bacterium]|nr:transposase [Spirochaetota bacterium]
MFRISMRYDPEKQHRKSIRLKDYDYSQAGFYFVTICTKNRECVFGEVVGGEVVLSHQGQIVEECWKAIPEHYPSVRLDEFVIIPNHVHGILCIEKKEDKE